MKHPLLFDFTVDKSAKTVKITREFAASRLLVWDAFTQQEILDQWWAPKPWVSQTKHMDFREGGRRFYAMVSPEGQEHWSVQQYTSISPVSHYSHLSAFADKDENILADWPSSVWELTFREQQGNTIVHITITHTSLADLEKLLAMGFQGGITMIFDFLDEVLLSASQPQ